MLCGALLSKATGIILIHNHPSGKLKASNQDISITKKVKSTAEVTDIKLLDHLILNEESYSSLLMKD